MIPVKLVCGCPPEYRCSRCGFCYQHEHVRISAIVGWRCPDGGLRPPDAEVRRP